MAKRKTKNSMPTKECPKQVVCAECRHFKRDIDGISRVLETGMYFMGVCELGLKPDSPIKQFAIKPRICKEYRGR